MTNQTSTINPATPPVNTHSFSMPQSAAVLAYAGALPLIVAVLCIILKPEPWGSGALEFMAIYGGLLIAFFGGVRWGVAVMRAQGPTFRHLLGGVLPLIVAAPILVLDDIGVRLMLIVIALPVLLFDDLKATKRGSGAPEWYLGVRMPLTILMEFSFIIALAMQFTF